MVNARQSGSMGHRETSAERRHRQLKASGSNATEHGSPVQAAQSALAQTNCDSIAGRMSRFDAFPRHPSKQRSDGSFVIIAVAKKKKQTGCGAPSSKKGDIMSLLVFPVHSRSMPVSLSQESLRKHLGKATNFVRLLAGGRRQHRLNRRVQSLSLNASVAISESLRETSGQSDQLGSLTPEGDSMSLWCFQPYRSVDTSVISQGSLVEHLVEMNSFAYHAEEMRTGTSSPVKSIKSSRRSLHQDPGRVGIHSPVQLHGTPRRSTEKDSTGRITAKPEQSPFSSQHLAGCMVVRVSQLPTPFVETFSGMNPERRDP
jgi:hypothetical protein